MQNIIKKLTILALIGIIISPFIYSQPKDGLNLRRLEDKLNLTDSQKDQIENLRIKHQKDMVDLKAKLEKARIELREVTADGDFTRSEYLAAHNKMIKMREEIQLAAANHRMDVFDLLDKDQKKIMAEKMKFGKGKKHYFRRGGRDYPCDFDGPGFRERRRMHW
jgi:Spy/CpxP family protein refolding chaperone